MELWEAGSGVLVSQPEIRGSRPLLAAVRDGDSCIGIDLGASPAHRQQFLERLESRWPNCSLNRSVLTHAHWDHYAGCGRKEQVYLTAGMLEDIRQQRDGEKMSEGFSVNSMLAEYGDQEHAEARFGILAADHRIVSEPELRLSLSGQALDILRFSSDHAEDNLVVFLPDEGIVFLGDVIYQGIHGDRWFYTERIFQVLDQLIRLEAEWYLGSHREKMSRNALLDFRAVLESARNALQTLGVMPGQRVSRMLLKNRWRMRFGTLPDEQTLTRLMWFCG